MAPGCNICHLTKIVRTNEKTSINMQTPRSPNIAELGSALFSSCAKISRLEIIDVTSSGITFLLFGARRNGLNYTRYRDYRGYPEVYEDVASIYIGYQDEVRNNRIVTYLVHDWFHMQDPLIDDDNIEHVLMDNMRDVVRKMLFVVYTALVPILVTIYSF